MNALGEFLLGILITWLVAYQVIKCNKKNQEEELHQTFLELRDTEGCFDDCKVDLTRANAEVNTLHKILDKERKRRKKEGTTYHENIAKHKKEYELLSLQLDIVALRYAEANAYIADLKTRVIQ